MKTRLLNSCLLAMLTVLAGQIALSQSAQFQVPMTITNGTNTTTLTLGVSGDGPGGSIQDNTIGVDFDASFGAYQETSLPPLPPSFAWDARLLTILGRTSTFPTGLGAGVSTDYRDFRDAAQVDSFRVNIAGDDVDVNATTISWPSNLSLYGTQWTIKPQSGTEYPSTDMLTTTSLTLPAGVAQRNVYIIKVGASSPSPGPNFVLSASSLDFGTVTIPGSATRTVTVTNTGSTNALSIAGVTSIANYNVAPSTFPVSVAAGASQTFTLTFTPSAAGTFAGNVVFTHNAAGSPTNLAVTGIGSNAPTQGGTLEFGASTRTRLDNTTNYADSLKLVNYVGQPLKGLELRIITNGLVIVRSVTRGRDIPAPAWSFSSVIARGPANVDGSSNDTIKVVIYGTGSTALAAGTYNNLLNFTYDAVNISDPDVQTSTISLANVLGGLVLGEDAQVVAGPAQTVTLNNRTMRGDINNDDRVDILDLLMVVDHILNRITLTGDAFTRGNIAPWPAGDGAVNILDLTLLQNIILTGQYPDGSPTTKPVHPPIAGGNGKSGNSVSKMTAGVDARVTFYVTQLGIAVRLENAVPVKGVQLEFGNVPTVPENMNVTTLLGDAYYLLVDELLRVLMYNQNNTVIEPGDRILGNLPFSLVNPSSVTLENVVLAGSDNKRLTKVETELSLNAAIELPVEFSLAQNYPNPFNPSTTIRFAVPQTSDVRISIYNTLGQEVRTLFAGSMERGTKEVQWDGRNNLGNALSSGLYVYRMTAGSFSSTKKMLLMK